MTIENTTTNKVSKPYSLDPIVIAWVSQKALRLGSENGERVSDSKVVNDILTAAMEHDIREETNKVKLVDTVRKIKVKA